MAPLRIGLIGAGRIVPAHLRGYAALRAAGIDDFRITAICSRDPARAQPVRHGCEAGRAASARPGSRSVFAPADRRRRLPGRRRAAHLHRRPRDARRGRRGRRRHHHRGRRPPHPGARLPRSRRPRPGREAAGDHRPRGPADGRGGRATRAVSWPSARTLASTDRSGSRPGWSSEATSARRRWPRWIALGTAQWSPDRWVGNSSWRHRKLIGAGGASLDIGPHLVPPAADALRRGRDRLGGRPRLRADPLPADATARSSTPWRATPTTHSWRSPRSRPAPSGSSRSSSPGTASRSSHGPILYGSRGCIKGETLAPGRPGADHPRRVFRPARRRRRRHAVPARPVRPVRPADRRLAALRSARAARPRPAATRVCTTSRRASPSSEASVAGGRHARRGPDGAVDGYQRELDEHYGLLP